MRTVIGKTRRNSTSLNRPPVRRLRVHIDAALAAAGKDPTWLHRKLQPSLFSRRTPIEHMVARGMDGMTDVLHVLNRAAMQEALAKPDR
jgi:hypothetical protein